MTVPLLDVAIDLSVVLAVAASGPSISTCFSGRPTSCDAQGKGDHWVYTHARRRFPLTVDPRNPLLPAYVSKAIRAIEEVLTDDEED